MADQSSGPLRYAFVDGMNVRDTRVHNYPSRWNAAPSQELLVIRRNHQTGEVSLDPLRWRLIPHWCKDPSGGRKPINAKCETVRNLLTFRDAYRLRRCIVPVDGFFEWKAIKGQKAKQPYANAMKDGSPFGLGGLWENWKDPATDEWIRTFAVITTDANALVAEIHDRMPVILAPEDYARWLGAEPDPHDLMRPFPAGLMRTWPISTRVNKPENDDTSIVEPIELATDAASRGPRRRAAAVRSVCRPEPQERPAGTSKASRRLVLRGGQWYGRPSELHQPSRQSDKHKAHESCGPFQSVQTEKSALGRRKCGWRHRHAP